MKADEAIQHLREASIDLLIAIDSRSDEPEVAEGEAPPTARSDEAGWTPRQVLAHVVWWHERYLAVLSAKVDDRPHPKLPGKLDDINVVGLEAYGDRSIEDLTAALRTKQHALESLTGVLFERPDRAEVRVVTRDESGPIDLEAFVQRVTGHLHGHARDLRRR
jgi:hypothetical protein